MYSKKYKSSKFEALGDLCGRIQDLGVRESLWISRPHVQELFKVRWLIYAWFSEMKIKKYFRLQVIDEELCVTRIREL